MYKNQDQQKCRGRYQKLTPQNLKENGIKFTFRLFNQKLRLQALKQNSRPLSYSPLTFTLAKLLIAASNCFSFYTILAKFIQFQSFVIIAQLTNVLDFELLGYPYQMDLRAKPSDKVFPHAYKLTTDRNNFLLTHQALGQMHRHLFFLLDYQAMIIDVNLDFDTHVR